MKSTTKALIGFMVLLSVGLMLFWQQHRDRGMHQRSHPSAGVRGAALPSFAQASRVSDAPTPGTSLRVELVEGPAEAYGTRSMTEADRLYRDLVRSVDGLGYDVGLGHAAREVAAFYALYHQMAPTGALQFMLDAGGAAFWDVRRAMIMTTRTDLNAISERLNELSFEHGKPGGLMRVGIGEAYTINDPPQRYISILMAREGLSLDPVPRRLELGQTLTIQGELPPSAWDAQVLIMRPDLVVESLPVAHEGQRFTLALDAGDLRGALQVEILAATEGGPRPFAQLTFHVDEGLPTVWDGAWAPDESGLTGREAALEELERLLDGDRMAFGLDPLKRDPRLDAVADGHARDMRDNGFVGHRSPSTGTVADRLRAVSYKTVVHGENVAMNSSVWDAQEGLLYSLGHRKNILSTEMTHLGLGVALRKDAGQPVYYLTQIFARPAARIQPEAAYRELVKAVQRARREAGLSGLSIDPALTELAERQAGRFDTSPREVLDAASRQRLIRRGGAASVSTLAELSQFEVPAKALKRQYSRLGLAVIQHDTREGLDIVVVVILGA